MRRALACLTVCAASLCARNASASPWTLPRGTIALSGTFGYQSATQEFFEYGAPRNFPLRGRYIGTTFHLGVRVAFLEGLAKARTYRLMRSAQLQS